MSEQPIKLADQPSKEPTTKTGGRGRRAATAVGGEIQPDSPLHRLETLPRQRSWRPLLTTIAALGGLAVLIQQAAAVWQIGRPKTPTSTTQISLPSVNERELELIRSREAGQQRVVFDNVPVSGRTNPFIGVGAAAPATTEESTTAAAESSGESATLPASTVSGSSGDNEYASGDKAPSVNTNSL